MEHKFVGKLVFLDRGEDVEIGAHAALVGGVLLSHDPIIQDPNRAEMWEVEVTIRPLSVHRGYVFGGDGMTMDRFLTGDYHDPKMWNEHEDA